MAINKFRVFTWDRILIYLGACGLFPLLACLQAFRFNYLEHTQGIPLPGWLAMIGALLGFALGDTMLFKTRNDFKKQITGYSDTGVGVLMPSWPTALPAFETVVKDIDAATAEIVSFWQRIYPNTSDKMEAYVNGSILGFTSQVIDLTVHAPGAQLIIPNGFKRWAVGATSGQYMAVMWLIGETWPTVLNRVKHELSHVTMNSISILDADQDNIMSVDKFPY
jgi:hypothetical protein